MKSKTSFFKADGGLLNRTLFVRNLTRFWPLWGLASFAGALAPLAVLNMRLRGQLMANVTPAEFDAMYYNVTAYAGPVIMLGYSIFCAMAVWGYLYNAKSVSLMHTLPIRREGLFVTNFLSGMAMIAVPCAVTGLLSVLVSLVCRAFDPWGLLVTVLCIAGEGFFYFTTATVTAFVTGHISALPLLYYLFHFLAPLCDFLVSTFSSQLIFGLTSRNYTGVVNFLSPTVFLLEHLNVEVETDQIRATESLTSIPFSRTVYTTASFTNAWLIGVYALVGVGLLLVAWLLYKYRRSECAGDVIALNWAKPLFQFGFAAVMALGGGQLLYYMFWNGFDYNGGYGAYALLPLAVCMVIMGLIGYYASAMLLAKSLRVFHRRTAPGALATAAGCVLVCLVVGLDLLNIAGRIPDNSRIAVVTLRLADNTYNLYPGEDEALIDEVKEVQRSIIADKDYIRNFDSQRYWEGEGGENVTFESFRVTYALKNGLDITRYYGLELTKERLETPGTFEYQMDALVNGEGMKNKRLHAGDPRWTVEDGTLYLHYDERSYDLSSRELKQVMDALMEDTASGAWNYNWFASDADRYAMELHLGFTADYRGASAWDYITVSLRPGMEATIQALRDMGYLRDGDLLTWNKVYELWETERNPFDDEEEWETRMGQSEYAVSPRTVSPQTVLNADPVETEDAADSAGTAANGGTASGGSVTSDETATSSGGATSNGAAESDGSVTGSGN